MARPRRLSGSRRALGRAAARSWPPPSPVAAGRRADRPTRRAAVRRGRRPRSRFPRAARAAIRGPARGRGRRRLRDPRPSRRDAPATRPWRRAARDRPRCVWRTPPPRAAASTPRARRPPRRRRARGSTTPAGTIREARGTRPAAGTPSGDPSPAEDLERARTHRARPRPRTGSSPPRRSGRARPRPPPWPRRTATRSGSRGGRRVLSRAGAHDEAARARAAGGVHRLHDATVGYPLVRFQHDSLRAASGERFRERALEARLVHGPSVQPRTAPLVQLERDFVAPGDAGGRGGRQREVETRPLEERGGHDVEQEQQEHHVDQRRDVDQGPPPGRSAELHRSDLLTISGESELPRWKRRIFWTSRLVWASMSSTRRSALLVK